jgi:hypothetical protein
MRFGRLAVGALPAVLCISLAARTAAARNPVPSPGAGPALAVLALVAAGAVPVEEVSAITRGQRLDLSLAATRVVRAGPAPCRICGPGLPDARLGTHLRLGADSSNVFCDRLRVYVKVAPQRGDVGEKQLSVDVSTNSAVLLVGARF